MWKQAANNSFLFAFSPDEESSQKFIPFVGVSVITVTARICPQVLTQTYVVSGVEEEHWVL